MNQEPEKIGSRGWTKVDDAISPVGWRHIHLNGHYTFRDGGQPIEKNVAGLRYPGEDAVYEKPKLDALGL